jgi:DNA-binding MarR family transcriptional regulator
MGRTRQQLIGEVGGAVQAFQRSTDAFDDAVAAHLGLNRTDLRCLDWLSGGPMPAGEVSQATGLSSAATTKLIDRLEQRGLVRRVRSDADRWSVLIEMTPKAVKLSGEVYGPLVADGTTLLGRYDVAELTRLRDYFTASTGLIDDHRRRIMASSLPRSSATTAPSPGRPTRS